MKHNYTTLHYTRLKSAIRRHDVRIIEHSTRGLEWTHCTPFSRVQTIRMGTDVPRYLLIASLVHEFGHILSRRSGQGLSMGDMMGYRFDIASNPRAIMAEERRAWRLGLAFMRRIGIPVCDRIIRARRILLASHTRNLRRISEANR